MYTCNKKLHFSRTSVPDLISIKRPVVNGQITVQNWSISATEEKPKSFRERMTEFDREQKLNKYSGLQAGVRNVG